MPRNPCECAKEFRMNKTNGTRLRASKGISTFRVLESLRINCYLVENGLLSAQNGTQLLAHHVASLQDGSSSKVLRETG